VAARGMWALGADGASQVTETAARLGATYVLIDKRWMRRVETDRLTLCSPSFRQQHMRLEWDDAGAFVYKIGASNLDDRTQPQSSQKTPGNAR
jgi:hypothetical protein